MQFISCSGLFRVLFCAVYNYSSMLESVTSLDFHLDIMEDSAAVRTGLELNFLVVVHTCG